MNLIPWHLRWIANLFITYDGIDYILLKKVEAFLNLFKPILH